MTLVEFKVRSEHLADTFVALYRQNNPIRTIETADQFLVDRNEDIKKAFATLGTNAAHDCLINHEEQEGTQILNHSLYGVVMLRSKLAAMVNPG